jgi:ADP-ribose pyrophosphatase YjhB (NUDIX family)
MPYTTTADLPASVRDIIETATGRLLFLGVLKRAGAEGASDVVAFSRAWAGLSRAGYVEHPDGMWRRLPPAQRADTAALTRAVKAAARIEAMGRGYFKACKDCSGSTAPTCKAQGRCLAVAAKAYNPAQPRANDGKWTVGGFGAGILAPQFGGSPDTFMAKEPPVATALADNANPDDIAVFTSDFDPGEALNGTPFKSWEAPVTDAAWAKVDGQKDIGEPPMPKVEGKRPGSGVIIEEPDGRIWLIEPTNHFGGYEHTFPKGGLEKGLSPQANAIKETWEEAGLKVEITGYLGDFERTTSVARYYTARRTGGTPKDHGPESQSVKLVPKADLAELANHAADAPILAAYLGVAKADISYAQVVAKKKSGGGWNQQLRAPSGSPIGGQWVAYGTGGFGAAVASIGKPLELQALEGKNMQHPDIVNGNAKTALFMAKANAGDVAFFDALDASGKAPKGTNTYSKKVVANYVEAKAYAKAKQATSMGMSAPASAGSASPKSKGGEPAEKLSSYTYDSPKPGGSAKGAVYTDADGQKWLVKAYPDSDQARQEVLAANLYKAAGAGAPDMKLVDLENAYIFGGTGVASKWVDSFALDPGSKTQIAEVRKDFAADAWLGNWDAVGLAYDNVRYDGAGKMLRVDPGGSLEYRAMGDKKGAAWNKAASEWETLRDPGVNAQSAKVFGGMSDAELKASAAKLAKVDDATIKALAADALPRAQAAKMADTLIARRDAIIAKAGLDADHAKAPGKLEPDTSFKATPPPAATGTGGAFTTEPMVGMPLTSSKVSEALSIGDIAAAEQHLSTVNNPKVKAWGDKQITDAKAFYGDSLATSGPFKAGLLEDYPATTGDLAKKLAVGDIRGAKQFHEGIAGSAPEVDAWFATNLAAAEAHFGKAPKPSPAAQAGSPAAGVLPDKPAFDPAIGSTKFYETQVANLQAAALKGDMAGVAQLAAWEPKSNSAKKSANFTAYKAHADGVLASMAAKADAVPDHMGPKSKPAAGLDAAKVDAEYKALFGDATPSTASSAPPPQKFVVASASNAGEQVKFDAIHEAGLKGDADAIAAMSYGSNTYGKQQAKLANEWLVHHGYEPSVFPGMNVKSDPNKGLHKAKAAVPGATPKPAISEAPKITAAAAAPKPTFKAERISSPSMDFENWNGPGKGLSSTPAVNKANSDAVKVIHAAAVTGDTKKLEALTFPEVDKATGAPTGKMLPMAQHPSQHVKGYFEQTKAEIDYQLNPPVSAKVTPGSVWSDLSGQANIYHGALTDAALKSAGLDKLGNYVVLGAPGVVPSSALAGIKPFLPTTGTYKAKAQTAYNNMPQSSKDAIKSYTGSGYGSINKSLWSGNPSGAAAAAASALKTHGHDLTPGTLMSRKVTLGNGDLAKLHKATGKVLQEPAISSTAITPQTWGGNVQYKMMAGEGVKGLYVGPGTGISLNISENEIVLPPNTRMLIQKVTADTKYADADGFGGGGLTVVEVLILPTSGSS